MTGSRFLPSDAMPEGPHKQFMQAIETIVTAAEHMKTVVDDGDPDPFLMSDDQGLPGRIPSGAYCLSRAIGMFTRMVETPDHNQPRGQLIGQPMVVGPAFLENMFRQFPGPQTGGGVGVKERPPAKVPDAVPGGEEEQHNGLPPMDQVYDVPTVRIIHFDRSETVIRILSEEDLGRMSRVIKTRGNDIQAIDVGGPDGELKNRAFEIAQSFSN